MVEQEDGMVRKRSKKKKVPISGTSKTNNVAGNATSNKDLMKKKASRVSSDKLTTKKPEVGKRIRVYRNGDAYHKGISIVLNMRQEYTINSFLDAISERIGLIQGAKRLYALDGMLIRSTEELENNKEYVASSGAFLPLPYGNWATNVTTTNAVRRGSSSPTFVRGKEGSTSTSSSFLTSSKNSAPGSMTQQHSRYYSRSVEPKISAKQVRPANGNQPINTAKLNGSHNGEKILNPQTKTPMANKRSVSKGKRVQSQESSMSNMGLEVEVKVKPKEKKNLKLSVKKPDDKEKKAKKKERIAANVKDLESPRTTRRSTHSHVKKDSLKQDESDISESKKDNEGDEEVTTEKEEHGEFEHSDAEIAAEAEEEGYKSDDWEKESNVEASDIEKRSVQHSTESKKETTDAGEHSDGGMNDEEKEVHSSRKHSKDTYENEVIEHEEDPEHMEHERDVKSLENRAEKKKKSITTVYGDPEK